MAEYVVKDRNGRIIYGPWWHETQVRDYARALNRDYQTDDYRVERWRDVP